MTIIELASSTNFDGKPSLHPERKGQLNRSPLKNWAEKNGGLPTYINSVATAILRENPSWSISRVIATAVNWAKKTCATGRAFGGRVSVSKAVQTAACAAVAAWERKKKTASAEFIDAEIIRLAGLEGAEIDTLWVERARKRVERRGLGRDVYESIALSDEEFIHYAVCDLEDDWGEGVNELEMDADKWVQAMELAAAPEMSLRLPAIELGGGAVATDAPGVFRKEIWRVGDINYGGAKVRFTSQMLKGAYQNFKKGHPFGYIPFQFLHKSVNGEDHPKDYAGKIVNLSVDDEENPQRMYADFSLTEDAQKIVKHNPQFGVSVKVHPNFVHPSTGQEYGPMLLHVAGTHFPRMSGSDSLNLGDWTPVAAGIDNAGETIDLSQAEFEGTITASNDEIIETRKEGDEMSEQNKGKEQTFDLSAVMESDAFKDALKLAVDAQTETLRKENETLREGIGNIRKESYVNTVKGAVDSYRAAGVPPVMLDAAEALLLSFDEETRNESFELSYGEGDNAKTETLSRVAILTKMLDEAKGFVDLGREKGSGQEPDAKELSAEQEDEAAMFLASLTGLELANNES